MTSERLNTHSSLLCVALGLAFVCIGTPALAQDTPAQTQGEETEARDDEAGLDDDIFTPSEAIEADSEISFPADI